MRTGLASLQLGLNVDISHAPGGGLISAVGVSVAWGGDLTWFVVPMKCGSHARKWTLGSITRQQILEKLERQTPGLKMRPQQLGLFSRKLRGFPW